MMSGVNGTNRQLLLRERPTGEVTDEHFELVEAAIPEPGRRRGPAADTVAVVRPGPARLAQRRPFVRAAGGHRRGDAGRTASARSSRRTPTGSRSGSSSTRRSAGRTTSSSIRRGRSCSSRCPRRSTAPELMLGAARHHRPHGVLRHDRDRSARRGRHRARHVGRRSDRIDRRADRPDQGRRAGDRHGRRRGEAGVGPRRRRLRRVPRPLRRQHPPAAPRGQPRTATTSCSTTSAVRCSTPPCSTSPSGPASCSAGRSRPATSRSARRSGCTTTSC